MDPNTVTSTPPPSDPKRASRPRPAAAQITSDGRPVQAPGRPITVRDLGIDPAAADRGPASLYMHVPFCTHKCHYCDFYSLVDQGGRQAAYVDRLLVELEAAEGLLGGLETIFVGGGTPTLLAVSDWERILRALAGLGRPPVEFSVEANPETVTSELARALAAGGVNRMSIGAQTFNLRHLATLERHHDPASVPRAVEAIRSGGIDRISLDLIFGIPGQTVAEWEDDLDRVLALEPEHLSCYALTYEPATALTQRRNMGLVEPIDPDLEAEMYDVTCQRLAAAGFERYETSNWALPGAACRHNLAYWRDEDWWALGTAAAGHHDGWRWRNVPRLSEYLEHGPLSPIVDAERATVGEAFMMGLRLTEGMPLARVEALLAREPDAAERRRTALAGFIDDGWLVREATTLRVTDIGARMGDRIALALL